MDFEKQILFVCKYVYMSVYMLENFSPFRLSMYCLALFL